MTTKRAIETLERRMRYLVDQAIPRGKSTSDTSLPHMLAEVGALKVAISRLREVAGGRS